MTNRDNSPWAEVGHELAKSAVMEARYELENVLRDVERTLREGENPTVEQIYAIRRAHDKLQKLTEEALAAVAEGTEPWEWGSNHLVTNGTLLDVIGWRWEGDCDDE